jgi:hypothetical protein
MPAIMKSGQQRPKDRKLYVYGRRHPVVTFFSLACVLSWAAIFWQSFFAPGVLVAALIVVSLTEGVAGVRAMGSR